MNCPFGDPEEWLATWRKHWQWKRSLSADHAAAITGRRLTADLFLVLFSVPSSPEAEVQA